MTDPTIPSLLRLEVAGLRARESRQRFDTVVHLGALGGERRTCTVPTTGLSVVDAGTRTEVVSWLLECGHIRAGQPAGVWLTRAGDPQLQDEDLAWLSAAGRAFGALGCRLEASGR